MAKGIEVAAFLAFAVFMSGLVGFTHGDEKKEEEEFTISGFAYCDTCRVEFQTKLSFPLNGVKVGLECYNETTKNVTFKTETESDQKGTYKIKVLGDHEEDICEVTLLESTHPTCNQVVPGAIRSDRVPLTNKSGVFGYTRFANVLSFATKEHHPDCMKTLLEMGMLPEEINLQ